MTEPRKPREFKLIVEPWRTNAFSWDQDNLNELTTGEVIHVREVIQDTDIIIDLIHQRSIAFDEAREAQERLGRTQRALDKAKKALNILHLGMHIDFKYRAEKVLREIDAILSGES